MEHSDDFAEQWRSDGLAATARQWDVGGDLAAPLLEVAQGARPWSSYAKLAALFGAGRLEALYRAGYLDGWHGVADGEDRVTLGLGEGRLVTLTPWGADRLGLMLVERSEARPRWEPVAFDEAGLLDYPAVVAPKHPREVPLPRPDLVVDHRAGPEYLVDPETDAPVRLFAGEGGKGGVPVTIDRRLRGKSAGRRRKRATA